VVRLACTKCERRGQYRKATLIERYGADANIVDLRLELAEGCPEIAADKVMDRAASTIERIGRLTESPPAMSRADGCSDPDQKPHALANW
jgi:hypothetical protein